MDSLFLTIILLILSAIFAAADQVVRFPDRFMDISRLPGSVYKWDLNWGLFPFMNAKKVYQGAKIWLMAAAWFVYPGSNLFFFFGAMAIWWMVIRNFFLHTILTKDNRLI